MKFKDYFKNLSNTLSGNFLAMLGFLIFSFTFVGILSRIVQGLARHSSRVFEQIPFAFAGETFGYIPFTCLFSLIPTIVLFCFLYKPILKLQTQLIILLTIFFVLISPNIVASDYIMGDGIFFAFALGAFPLAIIYALIFFVLLLIDSLKSPRFKNRDLIDNKHYKWFVLVFYLYALIVPMATGIYFFS